MDSERQHRIDRTRAASPGPGGDELPLSGAAPALLREARAWGAVAQGTLEECGSERELDLELRRRQQRGGE